MEEESPEQYEDLMVSMISIGEVNELKESFMMTQTTIMGESDTKMTMIIDWKGHR